MKELHESKQEIERLNELIKVSGNQGNNASSADQLFSYRQQYISQESARKNTITSGHEIFIDENGNRPSGISQKQTHFNGTDGTITGFDNSHMAMTKKIQEL